MAIFLDEPRKRRVGWFFSFLVILAIVLVIGYPEWELKYRKAQVETIPNPPSFKEERRMVKPVNGTPFRPDRMEGRIFQHRFTQGAATAGRSPDELAIHFGQAVEIHGIHVSADCWKDTRLVEFAGGIDQRPAYQTSGDATILFHSTFATTDTAGAIEETFWFPKPFRIEPAQAIRIGAWIQNNSPEERFVSPEFVLYFTDAESAPPPPSVQPRRPQAATKPQPLPVLPEADTKPRKPSKKSAGEE